MEKQFEVGQELTFASDIISQAGFLWKKKGDKAIIRDIEIWKGHWSRVCPDIWVPDKIMAFKIKGETGSWLPSSFEETKHLNNTPS